MYRGCAGPLEGQRLDGGDYQGKDGLGDVPDPDPPSMDLVQKENGINALIRIAKENPGEVRSWQT